MSIAYCRECEQVVEGNTTHGVEIAVNFWKGTKTERRYELCNFCGEETSNLPEDDPREDR